MQPAGRKKSKVIKRKKPNKKWTTKEIKLILNYVQEAPKVEAPTAQIFYKKLIAKTGIAATWDLVRWKVRHLKSCFKKANDWRNSSGTVLLEADGDISCVEGKILQICPHYKQLSEIFGDKSDLIDNAAFNGENAIKAESISILNDPIGESYVVDELKSENYYMSSSPEREIVPNNRIETADSSPEQLSSDSYTARSSAPLMSRKVKDYAEKIKRRSPKSSVAILAAFQAERTEMSRKKFEWEKVKHEKELSLNERQVKLEEEKAKAEIELKRLEIERDERLKILEIERDGRLKRYEIELKYGRSNRCDRRVKKLHKLRKSHSFQIVKVAR